MPTADEGALERRIVGEWVWVVEEQSRIGSMALWLWKRQSGGKASAVGPWEVASLTARRIVLRSSEGLGEVGLDLPTEADISRAPRLTTRDDHLDVKIFTAERQQRPVDSTDDLVVPFSASELSQLRPLAFLCAVCQAPVVDASGVRRFRALPSEHWHELLEAWMCHQDQALSEEMAAKGKGFWPKGDECLVGTTVLLFDGDAGRTLEVGDVDQVSFWLPVSASLFSFSPRRCRIYKKGVRLGAQKLQARVCGSCPREDV